MNTLSFVAPSGNLISLTVAGQGPALILLHGFPLDHRQWQEQLTGLSEYFRVIAPDLRGFGNSTLASQPHTMADLADDVEQMRLHLAGDEKIALCGLSMGGYVAFEYWRRHPQYLSALVLTNTKPEADDEQGKASRQAMIDQAQQSGSWSAVSGMLSKQLSEAHQQERGDVYQNVERMLKACSVEALCNAQRAMANRADFTTFLPRLSTPTLVIAGEEDSITPPMATRKWAAVMPHSQCHVVAGAAHLTPLEQPEQFNSLVREFLA